MTLAETLTEGFQLKVSDGASSPTFTAIPGILTFSGPSRLREIIEQRHHSSTSIVKKPGKLDPGTCQGSLSWDSTDTQQGALQTALGSGVALDFQAVFSDTGDEQYAFSAFVTKFQPSGVDPDSYNTRDFELTLDGDVVIT